jgi:hypothetical protein
MLWLSAQARMILQAARPAAPGSSKNFDIDGGRRYLFRAEVI